MAFTLVLSLTHTVGDRFGDGVHDVTQFKVSGPRLQFRLGVDSSI